MTTVHSIVSKTAGVLSYIDQNIRSDQSIDHEEVLKAVYLMYRLNPQSVLFTCPVSHKDFFYISENCFSLFGYDSDDMQRMIRNLPAYISQVHDADIEYLHDCMNFVHRFIKSETIDDPQSFRCFFYYRFRHANGSYIYLQDQKAMFSAANQTI